jgi:hypothetical protein
MVSTLRKLAEYIGAHRAADRDAHERDRARQRVAIATVFGLASGWAAVDAGRAGPVPVLLAAVPVFSMGYALLALFHLRWLLPRRGVTLFGQYSFIVLDSVLTVVALVGAPSMLAAFYPVLMVQIVRCGMRYGLRTLWLSWAAAALAAAALMPFSSDWTSEASLLRSFVVMMVIIPVLFGPLVQKLVRANDALRAAATADPLTGLGNRRMLFEQLRLARASSVRTSTMLAVVLFDLDSQQVLDAVLLALSSARVLLMQLLAEGVDRQAFDDLVLAAFAGDGVAEHHVLGDAVFAVAGMPMVTQPPLVPSAQSRMWSMAALAAEAADDRPRASMMAAPRLPTVGRKVSACSRPGR